MLQKVELAVDYLTTYKGKYLVLVCDGKTPTYNYIKRFFFNLNSDIQKYAKTNGHTLNFKTTYYIVDNFVYLEIK